MPMYLLETADYPGERQRLVIIEADSPETAVAFLGGSDLEHEYGGCYSLVISPENVRDGIPVAATSLEWSCEESRNNYYLHELPFVAAK